MQKYLLIEPYEKSRFKSIKILMNLKIAFNFELILWSNIF